MKLHLLFSLVTNSYIINLYKNIFRVRQIEKKTDFINSITFFKESDNSLFLYLEQELNSSDKYTNYYNKTTFFNYR